MYFWNLFTTKVVSQDKKQKQMYFLQKVHNWNSEICIFVTSWKTLAKTMSIQYHQSRLEQVWLQGLHNYPSSAHFLLPENKSSG